MSKLENWFQIFHKANVLSVVNMKCASLDSLACFHFYSVGICQFSVARCPLADSQVLM